MNSTINSKLKISIGAVLVLFGQCAQADFIAAAYNLTTSRMDLYRVNEGTQLSTHISSTGLTGWNTNSSLFTDQSGNVAYLFAGGAEIEKISLNTGIRSTVGLNRNYSSIELGSGGSLIGITYNGTTGKNEIYRISSTTGTDSLIKSFSFASGFWATGSFRVDTQNDFAYASSNGLLYQFNLNTGSLRSATTDTDIHAYDVGLGGALTGIFDDFPHSNVSVYSIDPASYISTLKATSPFNGGIPTGSFFASTTEDKAYLNVDSLYTFDLQAGTTSIVSLDRDYSALATISRVQSPVPEIPASLGLGFGLLFLVFNRCRNFSRPRQQVPRI